MSADPLHNVAAGEPLEIEADAWNLLTAAGRAHRAQQLGRNGSGPVENPLVHQHRIIVRNDTGSALDPMAVVASIRSAENPLDPVNDPHSTQGRPHLPVGRPVSEADQPLILPHGAEVDGYPVAIAAGVVLLDLDVISEAHRFACCQVDDVQRLKSSDFGPARILWSEPGTGFKRALVQLGIAPEQPFGGSWTGDGADRLPDNAVDNGVWPSGYGPSGEGPAGEAIDTTPPDWNDGWGDVTRVVLPSAGVYQLDFSVHGTSEIIPTHDVPGRRSWAVFTRVVNRNSSDALLDGPRTAVTQYHERIFYPGEVTGVTSTDGVAHAGNLFGTSGYCRHVFVFATTGVTTLVLQRYHSLPEDLTDPPLEGDEISVSVDCHAHFRRLGAIYPPPAIP